jgi:apolipoprotein N-acyltransferase
VEGLRLGWLTGFVLGAGGFYWIVGMLKTFSGFPTALCILFALVLWAAQGLQYGVFAWLLARLDRRGVSRMVSAPLMLAAVELTFPLLFPWYTANSLHNHPLLIQTADLGGVILVSWALALGHTALAEAWVRAGDWKVRLAPLRFPLVFWLFAVPYGAWQLRALNEEDGRTRALRVGVVQQNLGLMQKRNDPYEALRRHLETSRALEAQRVPSCWCGPRAPSRSASPRDPQHPRLHPRVGPAHPRALRRPLGARRRATAAARGLQHGLHDRRHGGHSRTYDKVYLLAFGEYIPGGETFPQLYDGLATAGTSPRRAPRAAARARRHRRSRSSATRTSSRASCAVSSCAPTPTFMAVILNDAWFGDTAEPWIHNALSKFRAVEHRRDLVRAANSGVSSIIDAAGRTQRHSGTFVRATVEGTVHLRTRRTLYSYTGDWIAYLGVLLALYGLAPRRLRGEAK